MPVVPTYPGVYIEEVPSGVRSITGTSTSVTAFVGVFERGPLNQPTRVFSFGEFERIFGSLIPASEAAYAIWQFFLNGGSEAIVVRIAGANAVAANASVSGLNTASIPTLSASLKFAAANPGEWANDVGIEVIHITADQGTDGASGPNIHGIFTLIVTQYDYSTGTPVAAVSETISNVTMDPTSPRYVQDVVNAESNLIRVAAVSGEFMPAETATLASDVSGGLPISVQTTDSMTISLQGRTVTDTTYTVSPAVDTTYSTLEELVAGLNGFLADAMQQTAGDLLAGTRAEIRTVYGGASGDTPQNVIAVVPGSSDPSAQVSFSGALAEAFGLNSDVAGTNRPLSNGPRNYLLGYGGPSPAIENYPVTAATPGVNDDAVGANEISPPGGSVTREGIYALEEVDVFNILVIPRISDLAAGPFTNTFTSVVNYCDDRYAFFILDPPEDQDTPTKVSSWYNSNLSTLRRKNAALYFPRLNVTDPISQGTINIGASGTMAGLYARTDTNRGVWKAPAGIEATLRAVQSLDYLPTENEVGTLNQLGVNCLRNLPSFGRVSWGARTLVGSDILASEWKYVPVRRLALFLQESLLRGTQFAVFEPNGEALWASIRLALTSFMSGLYRQGAFAGASPQQAYFVKCDSETTTQSDINNGIVNVVVGFAPLKPAEFVIIQFQQILSNS